MPDRPPRHRVTHHLRLRTLVLGLVVLVGLATATTVLCRTRVWGGHRAASRVHVGDLPIVHDAVAPRWAAANAVLPVRLEPRR